MAFEIKPKERHYLEVEIQGHGVSRVPLADSMPLVWLDRMREVRGAEDDDFDKISFFYQFFREYCGKAVDLLTVDDLGQLIKAWNDATETETGANPGE